MTATPPPAADAPWTVGRILEWTAQHLKKAGSDTPRLDAELLLAKARGCPRIQLYVQFNEVVPDAQRAVMRELVRRRAQSEPVAYLVGHREFFSLDFTVSPDVLIPRPDTETLVLDLVTHARRLPAPAILDVATGSGCIAIAAAVQVPAARVTASDLSPAALALARQNADRHGVTARVTFLEGDLLAPLPPGAQFDFVVSNPPYIPTADWETLDREVRDYEPRLALDGGPDGLRDLTSLLRQAPAVLVPGGRLLLEFTPEQAPALLELAAAQPELSDPAVLKDLAGRPRVLVATRR
ncbi:MAG: peptide chain release factor N(5)-glutamine methyltransferase [Planctomycetaceae bacterium]